MTLRSRAEIERSDALLEGAFRDPRSGPQDHLEALFGWHPLTDEELHARQLGDALELLAAHRGVVLPALPTWIRELAGLSEPARWCLAALLDACGAPPVDRVAERLGWRAGDPWNPQAVLRELLALRLVRGTAAAVSIVRRAS